MTPINQADSAQAPELENKKRVGDILREARVARDEELDQVADLLRIRLEYLRAIEENRPNDLPGTAYALGFVRTYASHLDLDTKILVDQFKVEAEEIEKLTELNFPEPLPAKSVPGGALVFMGLLLFGVFYGLWYYLNTQDKSVADLVPDLPPQIAHVIDSMTGAKSEETAEQTEPAQVEGASTAPEESVPENSTAQAPAGQDQDQDPDSDTASSDASPAVEASQPTVTENNLTPVETAPASNEPAEETSVEEAGQMMATETAEPSDPSPANEEMAAETTSAPDGQDAAAQTAQEVAETVTETAPDTPADTVASADEAAAETVEEGNVDAAEENRTEQPAEERAVAAVPSANLPTATVEPKIYGEENDGARVIITAKSTAWVEISSASGDLLLTRLLNSGDRYKVPNKPGITLITGNAGALEIAVDGKPVAPIGEVGAVVRDVSLDPDSLTTP
ncbi:helix-turn-helix domain-containing protein [Aestuariispira insulae]|uniref:Cytoskeleton protein RodZ n=1 Tax=Aestuariispira insulae TaxID=1461337 RepID=A0A3D9HGE4_9PROT|nr:helix-turn-helix domain-containing protein [Aestuariispira insulae]RED48066.1 cytoskeleton protein RodZ [Aestuariispira insulae]